MRRYKAANRQTVHETQHNGQTIRLYEEDGTWTALVGTLDSIGMLVPSADFDIFGPGVVTYDERTRDDALTTTIERLNQ